jgi:hypothetical protein
MADIVASIGDITRAPEQRSVRAGLERLETWRLDNPGAILPYRSVTYESPTGIFKVNFTPDFGVRLGPDETAVHIWNTARPPLTDRMVYAALSLFPDAYAEDDSPPDDLALLSLREPRLYRLGEAGRYAGLGTGVASRVEEMFRDVRDELGLPHPEERPSRPPR